jgi:hypothetical protein
MELLSVSPARIPVGRETMLTLTGKRLQPSLRIDLDSRASPRIGELVAWVGGVGPLAASAVAGAEALHILTPAELPLGRQSILIEDPVAGRKAQLTDAVEVFAPGSEAGEGDAAAPDGVSDASAGAAAGRDAGTARGGPDAAPGTCLGEICWYLGEAGATCAQTCQNRGGYHADATRFIGTAAQGGNAEQCAAILRLLGYDQEPAPASRPDVGLGCHLWGAEQGAYWLTAPDFAPNAGLAEARVVCGCGA